MILPPVEEAPAEWFADAESFRVRIVERCQPVVLRGAIADWPLVRAAASSTVALGDYLRRFASDVPARTFVGEPEIAGRYYYSDGLEGFNFDRVDLDLSTAVDHILSSAQSPGSRTYYVGSVPMDAHLPGLAEDNPSRLVPKSVRPRIWIGNASNVSCHYDAVDNLACAVAGTRRFTIYPPDAIGDLYVGPIDNTMAGRPVSMAAGAPDDTRYPRFAAARARAAVAELNPGDALYLPKLWWHQVEATDPVNVLVNYWWDNFSAGPDAPYTAMMLAMIGIAERPPAERAAWRAFFDHYVFRPDGHPLAHLAERQHGILGPLQSGNYRRIRSLVMQWLRA